MIGLLSSLALLGAACLAPGWWWARRRVPQGPWLLALPAAGVALWLGLALSGVGGPMSLGNVVEPMIVAAFAVAAGQVKYFLLDRRRSARRVGAAAAWALVAVADPRPAAGDAADAGVSGRRGRCR